MLRLDGVGKARDGRVLFQECFLELRSGEHAVVSGPSGAGKSTLLNCIAGLESFDQGQVYWEGSALNPRDSGAAFRLRNLGILFQEVHLVESLTVWQNLDLMAQLSGSGVEIEALLEAFGLLEMATKSVRLLSRGERQRVGLARALANRPRLLLADEPTASLDTEGRTQVLERLWEWSAEQDLSVVLVTHNQKVAENQVFSKRIVLG